MFCSWKDCTSSFPPPPLLTSEAQRVFRLIAGLALFASLCFAHPPAHGLESGATQDEEATSGQGLPVEGSLVDFSLDVWPIIQTHCLECHGPEDAKNDFRMDEFETVMDYLEPGDLESSSLWVDYLVTDDPDMRMPPVDHSSLSGPELATVRLWIEEGAVWPDELPAGAEASPAVVAEPAAIPGTVAARVWTFQGLFHPASVHFPVALLMVSGAMVLLSFLNRDSFEPVAFHCLWIGALGAVVASVSGWSYAQHEGYGAGYSFDLNNSAIDRHRWLGIGTAAVAIILIPMAVSVRKKGGLGMRIMWLIGSMILIVAVSFSGYQGGELTYGEDHYQEEFERLFPEFGQSQSNEAGSADTRVSQEESTVEHQADKHQAADVSESLDGDAAEPSGETAVETSDAVETPDAVEAEEVSTPEDKPTVNSDEEDSADSGAQP